MKSLLSKIFILNWPRKLISLILAIIVWFVVSQSMTTTKTLSNIGVRVLNVPVGKTVEGLQSSGLLQRRLTLSLTGNKHLMDELSSNDLEVVIDASDQKKEWIATISKKNIISLNPDINISRAISKVSHKNFIIRLTNLVSEKLPVTITQPIGQAPKGYQFLDIWPYQLTTTISGPEDVVKEVKSGGIKLTFNLNDITEGQLDDLQTSSSSKSDIVSFFVPNHWKQVHIPLISTSPIEIDDQDSQFLRIDFVRCELLPIENPLPVNVFFPPQLLSAFNPQKISIAGNEYIETKNGMKLLHEPLYAKGVSELFLDIVSDMMEIAIIASPRADKGQLDWSVQFINPRVLEDRYISTLLSDVSDDNIRDMQPKIREEYLRNRFRSYMNRFRLYKQSNKELSLNIELIGNKIIVNEIQDLPHEPL